MGTWSAQFNGAGAATRCGFEITDLAQTGLDPTGSFSFWFWVELLATTGHSGRALVHKGHSTNFKYSVFFSAADGSTIDIEVYETSGGNQHRRSFSGLAIPQDTPTQIVITFDAGAAGAGTQYELWKDGTSQGNGSLVSGGLITGSFDSDGPFNVGTDGTAAGNADSIRLFDLRFYSAVKAPSGGDQNQLLATPATEPNLQLNLLRGKAEDRWQRMVSGGGGFVRDSSTNANPVQPINLGTPAEQPSEAETFPSAVTDPNEPTRVDAFVADNGPGALPQYFEQAFIGIAAYEAGDAASIVSYESLPFVGIDAAWVTLVDGTPVGGGGATYRMRGYDTNLTSIVFWDSAEVDADASDYGGPGPVNDIVVHAILGAA